MLGVFSKCQLSPSLGNETKLMSDSSHQHSTKKCEASFETEFPESQFLSPDFETETNRVTFSIPSPRPRLFQVFGSIPSPRLRRVLSRETRYFDTDSFLLPYEKAQI